jgi:hypothetical protein
MKEGGGLEFWRLIIYRWLYIDGNQGWSSEIDCGIRCGQADEASQPHARDGGPCEGICGEGTHPGSKEGKTTRRTDIRKYTQEGIRNGGPYEHQNEGGTMGRTEGLWEHREKGRIVRQKEGLHAGAYEGRRRDGRITIWSRDGRNEYMKDGWKGKHPCGPPGSDRGASGAHEWQC